MYTNTITKTRVKEIIQLYNLEMEDFDLLKSLLKFESVSGEESKVAAYIKEKLTGLNFLVEKDSMGNIYAVRGNADEYAMINAHMDIVNLNRQYSSSKKSKYYATNSTGKSKSNKNSSTDFSALSVESYDYGFLDKDLEEAKQRMAKSKESEEFKNITISDDNAIKIWDENKDELEGLFGKDFREYGFKCSNCVNNCKTHKLCGYFMPNELLETKKQFAKAKLSYMKVIEVESKKDSDGYVQESFDFAGKMKSLKPVTTVKKNSTKDTEKYIIKVDLINDKISGSGKNRVLGGDDKCGIFIALKIAELLPDMPLKVLFTVQEETGCHGVKHFIAHHVEWLDNVKYSLTIDRRDVSHLLWSQRGTRSCDNNFAAELMYHGINNGIPVKLDDGGSADVVILRNHVPNAVNMSAGYYKAHTSSEYIVPSEVDSIVGWVKDIIEYV